MVVEIHPDASENFNRKAKELVSLVKEEPTPASSGRALAPDFYVDQTITEKDIIGEIKIGIADHLGTEVGKAFIHNEKQYGLFGGDYATFIQFVSNVQRTTGISDLASLHFVIDRTFQWIRDEFVQVSHIPYSRFLLEGLSVEIADYDVWIPIPFTSIEKELSVGKIMIRNISSELITDWSNKYFKVNRKPEEMEPIEQYEKKLRKDYQGSAAGFMTCRAERMRASEIAFYHLSRSLSVLRLFSPANHFPEAVSGAYEYGKRMIESRSYIIIDNVKIAFHETDELLDKTLRWGIGSSMIELMKKHDFDLFSSLISIDRPNDFQKDLTDAIIIYSKNALKRDLFDKILYILVALETVLLRNNTEPIQQSLADRMAFAIGRDLAQRKSIVETVKGIYSIRSNFIHHGSMKYEELSLIKKFMENAWTMFRSLIQNAGKFRSKQECIDAIEKIKYS